MTTAPSSQAEQADQSGTVVVGVDGSACAAQALDWGLTYAQATGRTVEAVMSWEWPLASASLAGMPYLDLSEPTATALKAAVAVVLEGRPADDRPQVRLRAVEGHPSTALLDAAEGADLLVVGSRGHGTLGGLLLGSTSLHCATHAPCPVVVVRPTSSRLQRS